MSFGAGGAVVFGGTGGIGRAICAAFEADGSPVLGLGRSDGDVTDPTSVERAVATAHDRFGAIHSVVFAAGRTAAQDYLSRLTEAETRAAFEVETFGFQTVVRAALPLLRQSQGSIVHIGSAGHLEWAARDGLSILPKAANEALVKGIAREEGRYSVRANSVLVGIVAGGMFERLRASGDLDDSWLTASMTKLSLKRLGTPEDVAAAVAFLASREAGYITGQTIAVSGGFGA